MADPDKIEPRFSSEGMEKTKVKEGMSTQVSELAQAAEALAGLLQKITDLGKAREGILLAKDLYAKGETGKAKEMTMGIFKRLQQIGKAPEGLDIQKVEEHLTAGTYDKLAESMRSVGGDKTPKHANELIDGLKKVENEFPIPKKEKDQVKIDALKEHNKNAILKKEELTKQIDTEVKGQRYALDKEEEDIQKEFSELLGMIEKKATIAEKVELKDVREIIENGVVGEVDTRAQVEKLKSKIVRKVQEVVDGGDLTEVKDKAELARRRKAADATGVLEGVAERVRQSAVGERAFIDRLHKLTEGMNKVSNGVEKGVGLQEAVRSLSIDEIREVRTLLSSLKERKDVKERTPYYDETYVDFVKGLGLDEEEALGLAKMLETVDVNYQKEALVSEPARPETINQRTMAGRNRPESRQPGSIPDFEDHDLIRDANDDPVHGMRGGLMDKDTARFLSESGQDHFEDLYDYNPDKTIREKSLKEQLDIAMKKAQRERDEVMLGRNEQRESFQNINMGELFKHMKKNYDNPLVDKNGKEILIIGKDGEKRKITINDMIDHDFYLEHQVAKLKDEYLNPADDTPEKVAKTAFEEWWYQEVSFEQRKLAYEGLFEKRSQSPRMQRLNSLMEIIGVATSKKGLANWMAMSYNMIDMQNNSYVNAEFMQKLAGFWTNQGVDFRLEHMLKQYRENISMTDPESGLRETLKDGNKKEVTINVFDTLNFMQEYVPDDAGLRTKLGIPEWWKGKWGTFIYKYSAEDVRGEARKGAWEYFLKNKKNVIFDDNFKPEQRTEVSNRYQLMFDLSFNYAVAHKQLYQMLGNASFREGEFELPAACAEMHLKLDSVLYSKLFVPRYTWLNAAFKEGWALFDPGVRDYITMAPQDYASHFVESGLVKKIVDLGNGEQEVTLYLAGETQNGSPTVLKTFFGEKFDKTELNRDLLTYRTKVGVVKDEDAVNKLIGEKGEIGAIGDRVKRVIELKKTFDGVLWHHGKVNKNGRKEALDFIMEWGVEGDQKSAYRNSSGVVSDKLRAIKLNSDTLESIDWTKYCEIAQDPAMTAFMAPDSGHSAIEKWEYFAKNFGEHSYNHTTPSAKRSGDHPVKYGVEAFNKYVETFMAWIQEPYNPEKFDALLDVPTAVNAGIVPGLSRKNLEFLMLMNEKMGFRYLGGGTMKRLWRDPEKATTEFNTNDGAFEDSKSEWPSYRTESISNRKAPWNPIQHKSIPESVGIGIPQDKQVMFDLIRGQRAKGRLPDNLYSDFYKKINKSTLYEAKLGLPINIYRWLTFEPIFEAIAPLLGVTSYELRKVLSETTSKTASGFLKYLNS